MILKTEFKTPEELGNYATSKKLIAPLMRILVKLSQNETAEALGFSKFKIDIKSITAICFWNSSEKEYLAFENWVQNIKIGNKFLINPNEKKD